MTLIRRDGREFVHRFAREGASVVFTGRSADAGKAVEHEARAQGHDVVFAPARCDCSASRDTTPNAPKSVPYSQARGARGPSLKIRQLTDVSHCNLQHHFS